MPSTTRPADDRETAIRTFLIADVRGYTHFTRERGDEAAARIAATFAEIAVEAIEAFDGRLIETRGDEVLAAFTSARRALRAGVELQDAFAHEAALDPSLPLHVGIGVAAGEAVRVGDGFRGNALNLAARLCARAEAGVVLTTEDLVGLAGKVDGVGYEPAGPLRLKGLDEPIRAVKVVPARPEPEPSTGRVVPGPLPDLPPELDPVAPLTGRERELRLLRWHWRRARHGHGGAVFVHGRSGTGKTRLAAELAREARAERALVLYAGCAGPAENVLEQLREAGSADRPTLLVADDLDGAGGTVLDTVAALIASLGTRPLLVVGTYRSDHSPLVSAVLDRADPLRESRLELEPAVSPAPAEPARGRRAWGRERTLLRGRIALAAGAGVVAAAAVVAGVVLLAGDENETTAARDATAVLNEEVLDAVVSAHTGLSNALAEGSSRTAIRRAAERALESVVRAEGAAAVVPLPGNDERVRQLLQLALVGHHGYARSVAVASRTLDAYQIGVVDGVARSAAAAYATLRKSLPGLRTPPAGDFGAAEELRELIAPVAPPPPPHEDPGGGGGGGCPTCAPFPPPASPPPPPPLPPRRSPTLSTTATEQRFAELRPMVDLDLLAADVRLGTVSPAAAAARIRHYVPELAALKAEIALLKPAASHVRARELLGRWIDASLRDVLAVQSWLAALQAADPTAETLLAQHRRRAQSIQVAKKAFLKEYERVSA